MNSKIKTCKIKLSGYCHIPTHCQSRYTLNINVWKQQPLMQPEYLNTSVVRK